MILVTQNTIHNIQYEANFEKGVTILDQFSPGWAKLVDVDNLEMDDPDRCILKQVLGDYSFGLCELMYKAKTGDIGPDGRTPRIAWAFVGTDDDFGNEIWRDAVRRRN